MSNVTGVVGDSDRLAGGDVRRSRRGSTWTNSGNLTVGGGTGTLTIDGGR